MKYMSVMDVVNNEKYPFSYGMLRFLLSHRKENGLNKAVRKIGRRLFLRDDLFDDWIENHFQEEKQ